jgi:hypothetical protein
VIHLGPTYYITHGRIHDRATRTFAGVATRIPTTDTWALVTTAGLGEHDGDLDGAATRCVAMVRRRSRIAWATAGATFGPDREAAPECWGGEE